MLRITKTTPKVVDLKWFTKEEMDMNYKGTEIDSVVIIPGVTQSKNWLLFDSEKSYIGVQFSSEADLERYFIQLMREIKLNQITNVNVEAKDSK